MSIKEFKKSLNEEGIEGEIVKTIFVSLLTSTLTLGVLYFLSLKSIENFIPKYGFFIFLSALSFAVLVPAIRQVRAYKEFPCMSGMMIGMTIGMISGFLQAYYVGSTNGMFWGSALGMAIGIFFGISNGKCCGIMGVMEGIMAGFMGGLMGAMTAVMVLNDNLKYLGIIIFIICATIMFGLNYMIYKESSQLERKTKENQFYTIAITFILITLTTWFIIYGPRSALFQ